MPLKMPSDTFLTRPCHLKPEHQIFNSLLPLKLISGSKNYKIKGEIVSGSCEIENPSSHLVFDISIWKSMPKLISTHALGPQIWISIPNWIWALKSFLVSNLTSYSDISFKLGISLPSLPLQFLQLSMY